MTNVFTVEVAARAAAPPKKTEGAKTPKGDDGFKDCLKACSQETGSDQEIEASMDEAVINAAKAAAMLLQMNPVQVDTAQAAPQTNVEPIQVSMAIAPQVEAEMPVEVKAHTQKAEAGPIVKTEAQPDAVVVPVETKAPVKAENSSPPNAFSTVMKTAGAEQKTEAQTVAAPKAEPVVAAPLQANTSEKLTAPKNVEKPVEVVGTEPAALAADKSAASVSVDLTKSTAEMRHAHLSRVLGEEIANAVASSRSSIRIQIQPENMGRIDVQLVSKSDGVQVLLTTDLAATGKVLESNLNQLQKALAEAGLTVSGLSVNSQGLQGQFSNHSQEQKSNPNQRFVNKTAVAAMPVEAIAARYSNLVSGLDFRI
jgi:flagellar hook-length control protein FliK